MPLKYRIDHARRLVLVEAHGSLSAEEVFDYQFGVWRQPEVHGYSELIDLTDVTETSSATPGTLRELAARSAASDQARVRARGTPMQSRLAIVAASDYLFGIGRMYEAFRELEPSGCKEVSTFHTRAEALAWLQAGLIGQRADAEAEDDQVNGD